MFARCLLCLVCSVLFVVCCLLVFGVDCSLFVVCCLLFDIWRKVFWCLVFCVCCLVFRVLWILFGNWCLSFLCVVCCLLLFSNVRWLIVRCLCWFRGCWMLVVRGVSLVGCGCVLLVVCCSFGVCCSSLVVSLLLFVVLVLLYVFVLCGKRLVSGVCCSFVCRVLFCCCLMCVVCYVLFGKR